MVLMFRSRNISTTYASMVAVHLSHYLMIIVKSSIKSKELESTNSFDFQPNKSLNGKEDFIGILRIQPMIVEVILVITSQSLIRFIRYLGLIKNKVCAIEFF